MIRTLLIALLALAVVGCETLREAREIPPPRSILESLAVAQGEIIAARDMVAFMLSANGENCREKPQTDLCALGFKVDHRTRDLRDGLDEIRDAYLLAHMDLRYCRIEYAGLEVPCEDRYDVILAGVIEVRKQIAEATRR